MSKRTAQSMALALLIGFAAQTSFAAPDEYDDSQSHPLRVIAYAWHPVGWLAEWAFFRPFHFLVSATPTAGKLFWPQSPSAGFG